MDLNAGFASGSAAAAFSAASPNQALPSLAMKIVEFRAYGDVSPAASPIRSGSGSSRSPSQANALDMAVPKSRQIRNGPLYAGAGAGGRGLEWPASVLVGLDGGGAGSA